MRVGAPLAAGLLSAALIAGGAAGVRAQTLDYGRLEQLFGGPVTTSATGSPQRVSDAPADMEIITADDIRRSGAHDLPEVLRHLASIDVQQWTSGGADVAVRGYDQPYSPRLLVLVNGRQVYLDHYGFAQWSAIPVQLAEIRQIEVVKGPNAALFGFNAVGGVINIVTIDPLVDHLRAASGAVGTDGFGQASGVATARIGDRLALKLSGGATTADEFARVEPLARARGLKTGTRRGSIAADARLRIDDTTTAAFEVTHAAAGQLDVTPGYVLDRSDYAVTSVLGRVAAETDIGLLQATTYTNLADHTVRVPQIGGPIAFHDRLAVAQVQDLFQLGTAHTIRVSGEYRHNSVNTAPLTGGTIAYDVGSLAGMWEWKLHPDLTLTTALRYDRLALGRSGSFPAGTPFTNGLWDRTLDEVSFNIGAVWRATAADTLRLTVARGLELPSLLEFGGFAVEIPGQFVIMGNPRLTPTTVTNYEAGWEHELADRDLRTKAAVFFQTSDDLPSLFTATATVSAFGLPILLADTVGDSSEIGVELAVKGGGATGWRWALAYAPRLVSDHLRPNQPPFATSVDFHHTTPRHVATAALGWSGGDWEADAFLRVQSDAIGFTLAPTGTSFVPVPVGPYAALDARIGYRLTDTVTLSLAGQNLATARQAQTSVGQVDRRVVLGLGVQF